MSMSIDPFVIAAANRQSHATHRANTLMYDFSGHDDEYFDEPAVVNKWRPLAFIATHLTQAIGAIDTPAQRLAKHNAIIQDMKTDINEGEE